MPDESTFLACFLSVVSVVKVVLKILLALLLGMATPVATNSDGDDEPKNDGEETTLPDPGPPGDIGHVPPKK